MKKLIILVASCFLMVNVFGQTTRNLASFSQLNVSGGLNVVLVQGDTNQLVIEAENDALLESVKSEIKDNQLFLYAEKQVIKKVKRKGKSIKTTSKSRGTIKATLTFKQLDKITMSGASDVTNLGTIEQKEMKIRGSGATDANLNVKVNDLTLHFSGASDLILSGSADNLNLKASGASDLEATNFMAKKVVVAISGASDATVNATESITGTASGASSIRVKGNPPVKAINKSGVSSSSSYHGKGKYNGDDVTIKAGKQHFDMKDEDVDVKLGNKAVVVKNDGDTVRLRWGSTQLIIIDDSVRVVKTIKKRRSHWAGVDLAINGFLNANNGLDLSNDPNQATIDPKKVTQFMELNYAKSWSFSINFMEFYFPIKQHNFGVVTGMGTEWSNYELKHNVKLNSEGGQFVHATVDEFNKDYTWGEVDTVLDYSKNRFKTWFINAPLLLEFNTGNNARKAFHISAGAIFGYNLQTKMKYKYRLNGENKKEKDRQRAKRNRDKKKVLISDLEEEIENLKQENKNLLQLISQCKQ